MNTQNDADNAADFEALYLAYKAKYEAARTDLAEIANHLRRYCDSNDTRIAYCYSIANRYECVNTGLSNVR